MFQIKVVGVGGCGINTIRRLVEQDLGDIEYIAIDTDVSHLDTSDAIWSIALEPEIIGKCDVEERKGTNISSFSRTRIAKTLRGADFVIITGGLGGRTGSAGVPLVAEIARECGASVIALVYMPFAFEGRERVQKSNSSLAALRSIANSVMVIENDRALKTIKGSMTLSDMYDLMNADFSKLIQIMASLDPDKSPSGRTQIRKLFRQGTQICIGWAVGGSDIDSICADALKNACVELDPANVLGRITLTEVGPDVQEHTVNLLTYRLRSGEIDDVPCWQEIKRDTMLGDKVRITMMIILRERNGSIRQ